MDNKQRQDIEQQLRTRINRLVDEALAEARKDKPLSLSEIEDIALAVRAKVGQEVAQPLVQEQGAVTGPGAKMRAGDALQRTEKAPDCQSERRGRLGETLLLLRDLSARLFSPRMKPLA